MDPKLGRCPTTLWGFRPPILQIAASFCFCTFMYIYLYTLMGTITLTALLGTFNMIASTLGQNLLWGRIADKYRVRARLVTIGEALAGVFYIVIFSLHRYLLNTGSSFTAGLSIIFGLSILEFFWSMSDVGWAALLTDVTTPQIRGSTVGLLNFIGSIGRLIGISSAGMLYGNGVGFSEGTIFYVVSTMLFTGSLVMFAASRIEKPISAKAELKKEPPNEAPKDGKHLYLWCFVSLAIVVLGATSINQVFLIFLRLPEGLHASGPDVSLILTTWTIGGMIASVLSGKLADRLERRRS